MIRITVYSSMTRVPERFHKALYKLTRGADGYMTLAARVLLGWKMEKPVVVAYLDGWPVGWMIVDPIDKGKIHLYVATSKRRQGIARRMAVALKKKYPRQRLGVYHGFAANVIKGLAKPRYT